MGNGPQAAFDRLRRDVPAAQRDTNIPHQTAPVIALVKNNTLLDAVEQAVGALL